MQIMMAFGSVLILLGLMMIVRKLAKVVGLNAEVQRKLVHIGTGLYALTFPWLFPDRWPVYMLIGLTLIVMMFLRLPSVAKSGLGSTLHGVERKSYGDILLAISIGVCFFLAQGNELQYVLPIAVLTLADAAAALAGTVYGTKKFQVEESHKSVEGSAVFFVITLLISVICLMLLSELPTPNILALSLMIAAFGTLVEAQSWRGFDNLFLPLGLLVFLTTHAERNLSELAILAGLFFLAIVIFSFLAPKFGLNAHAARVYVVVVFLLLAVTAIQNAVLPLLVLVAHTWSRATNPCEGKFPDLDIVVSLALVSFGWLVLGNATGWNAVSFYGISAMGLTIGLVSIALRPRKKMIRTGIIAALVILNVVRLVVVSANPAASNWAEPLGALALISLAVMVTITGILSKYFRTDRILKLTLLSLAMPLGYYLYAIDIFGIST